MDRQRGQTLEEAAKNHANAFRNWTERQSGKIKEILKCVDYAMLELGCVEIRDLPDNLQQSYMQAHRLLIHISRDLEMRLESDECENN